MSDFAVLGTIRSYLAKHLGEDTVTFGVPNKEELVPCCYLELEEIWTYTKVAGQSSQSCIKFKTICTHNQVGLRPGIDLNEKVLDLLDGHTFPLEDGRRATIRTIAESSKNQHGQTQKIITQQYETLIRG